MTKLKRGKYIGDRKDLYGETALVLYSRGDYTVEVQFDDLDKFDHKNSGLALGWHEFPKTDFMILDNNPAVPTLFKIVGLVFFASWFVILYLIYLAVGVIFA